MIPGSRTPLFPTMSDPACLRLQHGKKRASQAEPLFPLPFHTGATSRYVGREKRGTAASEGVGMCGSVMVVVCRADDCLAAHFHLRNGASMHRLNWLADRSGTPEMHKQALWHSRRCSSRCRKGAP